MRYYYFQNKVNNSLLLCYMMKGIEFIVLPIIAFIIYTRPRSLVKFSGSILGKIVMIIAVIGAASHNKLYGIIAATAMVLILENNYEGFEVSDISNIIRGSGAKGEDDDASKDADAEADADADAEADADADAEADADADADADVEEVDADADVEEVDADDADADDAEEVDAEGKETFIGSLLSNIGITSSNERIDKERKLQQGKCSNEEFTKMY
jgi:hypothetical protein